MASPYNLFCWELIIVAYSATKLAIFERELMKFYKTIFCTLVLGRYFQSASIYSGASFSWSKGGSRTFRCPRRPTVTRWISTLFWCKANTCFSRQIQSGIKRNMLFSRKVKRHCLPNASDRCNTKSTYITIINCCICNCIHIYIYCTYVCFIL